MIAVDRAAVASASTRLVSLDALRGFDMFWIIGAEDLVKGLRKVSDSKVVAFIADQLEHKDWEGFAFYDLIFPLFVFLAGASLVFSLDKIIEREGVPAALWRVARRTALLYLLGVFYYGGIDKGWDHIRWVGVLQRIGLSYGGAGLVYLACRSRIGPMIGVCVGILLGYWALLSFVPVPGIDHISFDPGENWANYIDLHYLPGRRWDGLWDPEGILSSFPAVCTCLLGVFAGRLLKNPTPTPLAKAGWLLAIGAIMTLAGYAWGLQLPIIKKIWTPSYVLVAGGYSYLLLAVFYLVIDVLKFRAWATPLLWIGTNALTIYLVAEIVKWPELAERLVGGEIKTRLGAWDEFAIAVVIMAMLLALVRFLYRRQIFLRV